jgi:hypothetical protein
MNLSPSIKGRRVLQRGISISPENVFFGSTDAACDSDPSKVDGKAFQRDHVLFYRDQATGRGANSLALGGELYVNGGFIALAQSPPNGGVRGMAIGSMAYGDEAIATTYNATAIGSFARAFHDRAKFTHRFGSLSA